MRSGSVTVNGLIVDPKMPFGGFKQSGTGREGGIEGLDPYFELKTIYFAELSARRARSGPRGSLRWPR